VFDHSTECRLEIYIIHASRVITANE